MTNPVEPRPYHHGDLRRALILAARQLLEEVGADALSLRAVAREAGVSPAAPYHHFKDKSELLSAVALQGYEELGEDMRRAVESTTPGLDRTTALGAAYVLFSLRNRALYTIMSGSARDGSRPTGAEAEVVNLMHSAFMEANPGASPHDLELATVGAWAALHGLSELSTYKVLDPLRARLGGEEAMLREVLGHLGVFGAR